MSVYDSRELSTRRTATSRVIDRELEERNYDSEEGFFKSLFDTSFESSITPRIIRASYILFMIFDALVGIVFLVGDWGNFLVRAIAGGIVCLVLLIWVRLAFETIMTLHNIEKYTRRTSRMGDRFLAIERNTRVVTSQAD
jgi:hypothetical protein